MFRAKPQFFFWACILVLSLVISGICLRFLAINGISSSSSLILRGGSCFLIVSLYALKQRLSLIPRSLRTQLIRALVAGFALMLFTISYNWLTASAISVLSNIDVPLLVVFGPLIGIQASLRVRALALFSISFLVLFVSGLEANTNLIYGLTSLTVATVLLCFGYLFIKKSMNEENQAVTILVPSIAIIVYGVIQKPNDIFSLPPQFLLIGFLSGASMFGAYYATMRLYVQTNIASAEFPTLISSLMIQPIEALFLDAPLHLTYLLASLGFVATVYLLLEWQKREEIHA